MKITLDEFINEDVEDVEYINHIKDILVTGVFYIYTKKKEDARELYKLFVTDNLHHDSKFDVPDDDIFEKIIKKVDRFDDIIFWIWKSRNLDNKLKVIIDIIYEPDLYNELDENDPLMIFLEFPKEKETIIKVLGLRTAPSYVPRNLKR